MLGNYGGLIFIFVVLVAAGGLISWVGDRVGTKIGKKRLSVWGLRPRHTATLSTVIAGCLIAAITFLLLMLVNSSVRRALLQGKQIVTANRRLSGQNAALRRQNAALTTTQQIAAQNAEVAQKEAKTAQIQAQTAANQAKLALQRLQGARLLLQTEQQKARLAAAQVTVAQSQLSQAQTQIAQAKTQRQVLLAKNHLLALTNNGLTHSAADLRLSGEFIYHRGDELGRGVIDTHQSEGAIYNELLSFLHEVGQHALQNHGRVGSNGRAVRVFTLVTSHKKTVLVPEKDTLKALAQDIADRPNIGSVVVIAQALFNTLPREQTLIQLHPYNNPLVIPKDAVIAHAEINGDEPQGIVSEALEEFLLDRVQPAARKYGIIPRTDPVTGRPIYGAPIDSVKSADLAQQVRQAGAHAQVTATAAQDTYAAGPLVLNLSVTP